MYQIKVDKSNKSAVFGKKIGAENSAPILNCKFPFIKFLMQDPSIDLENQIYQE